MALHHVLSSGRAPQRFLSHGHLPRGNPRRHFRSIYSNVGGTMGVYIAYIETAIWLLNLNKKNVIVLGLMIRTGQI